MTSLVKPEQQSKAAAIREQLPASIREKIEENRARNAVVAAIRGTQWGNGVSADTARAIAQYAHEHGIDPVTEIDVLGGRIYTNALYFRRRGAALIQEGVIRSIAHDQIGADPRLAEAVAECAALADAYAAAGEADGEREYREAAREAQREVLRRKRLRIQHNAPEAAAAVCVTTIALTNGVEVKGINWCGGGIRKGDPVGDAEPSKTAETRSERRAWLALIMSEEAQQSAALRTFARQHRVAREEGAAVAEIIGDEQEQIVAGHEAARPTKLIGSGEYEMAEPASAEPAAELALDDARPARRDALREG